MTRVLPPEEWDRLVGTELEAVVQHLDPARTSVLVVERDGHIVGCWALFQVLTVHGLWIDPAYRKRGGVARRLWQGMRTRVLELGFRAVETAACSEDVAELLAHVGAIRLPGEHFVLPVKG